MIRFLSIVGIVLVVCACSGQDDDRQKQEHVWKEQTDTLDKAREVEGVLENSAYAREQQLQNDTE